MKKEDNFETKNKEMIKKTHEYLKALPEIKEILNKIRYKKIQIFTKKKSRWNTILAQTNLK